MRVSEAENRHLQRPVAGGGGGGDTGRPEAHSLQGGQQWPLRLPVAGPLRNLLSGKGCCSSSGALGTQDTTRSL